MSGEEGLKVTVDFQRRDYAAFFWHMMFRGRANLIKFALATVGCFAVSSLLLGFDDWLAIAIAAGFSPIVAALLMVIWTFLDIALILLIAKESNGRLGEMTYVVDDEGFHVSSAKSSVTYKWSGVNRVRESRSQILIGVGGTCYMILPRRAFASHDDRDRFVGQIKAYAGQGEPLPAARASEREA
jgi:hypothetical protein